MRLHAPEHTNRYTGPANTENVGICHGGTQTCADNGTGYELCDGQVLPTAEICANGLDDDCNGTVDDAIDADGDGWTTCDGDCCDVAGPTCGSPALVNPGAIEVQGDGVDNNCNGQIDEDPYVSCSTGNMYNGVTAVDMLHAMDICQDAQTNYWGIVGTPTIVHINGNSLDSRQYSVKQQFGTDASNLAKFGDNMAVMSSGRARDANDPDPTVGTSYQYVSGNPPSDFVAPHGGSLPPTRAGCPAGEKSYDSVMLEVQLKAPINANSFSFQFRFWSQEYWHWTCTKYNDFFIAMLDSAWQPGAGQTPIPADKNISFDSNGNYISVNSTQFFTYCHPKTGYSCPGGTTALSGTGYDPVPNDVNIDSGAGTTDWLTTTSPVVPGETITLRFVISGHKR